MSLWNKILVGLIGVASLVFFVMAARTLKTHQYWADLAQKHEQKIKQVKDENRKLLEGADESGQMGIRQLRVELAKLLLDRSRAWFKCNPKVKLNPEDGTAEIAITIDQPSPHGIAEKTILYAFDEADVQKKGHFLGEFKVTKSDEKQKQVLLVPTSRLSPRASDHLAAAKGPWVLYETMPRDNHDVFASINDEEKKAVLSPESLSEYLNDGKPAGQGTPAEQVVAGKYVRPLRDYQVLFNASSAQNTLLTDQIDIAIRDSKLVEDALAQAKQQETAVNQEVATAKEGVKKYVGERDIVAKYRKLIEQEVTAVNAAIDELIKANKAMAGQLAKLQLEAARRIDERTRAMAQSDAGSQ